jgi:hypothetical protein
LAADADRQAEAHDEQVHQAKTPQFHALRRRPSG